MSLTGGRLGPYEVLAPLGAGGMGEVYRARDTRLGRDVALKVLPSEYASDTERRARFQREAQVLASLNHPNIATIHGLETADGTSALVLELVEGRTLAERIAEGPIPLDETVAIARQIADALEAAHGQNIIHRDLKPSNIKITPSGTVKVLDFGLAKLVEGPVKPGSPVLTASPTITSPAVMTGVGTILGTAAYMAPEQAKGDVADKRCDVWAFGCVLYEMLTGTRAFQGDDVTDILVAVLNKEPNWSTLPAATPDAIRRLLRRSLAKDRKARLPEIGSARIEIDEALTEQSAATATAVSGQRVPVWRRVVPYATAVMTAAGLAGFVAWMLTPAPPRIARTTISPAGVAAFAAGGQDRRLTITRDGTRVVYVGGSGRQLFVRSLDALEPTAIATVASTLRGVFISPDGEWVGFVENNQTLKKVPITGGPPVTLLEMDGGSRGATWGPDDTIILATLASETGLQRVSAAGGEPTVLTRPNRDRGEVDHAWPEILPRGRAVLFTILTAGGALPEIAVLDLGSGMQKVLVRGGTHAHYVASGHLVYAAAGTLRAVPFDLERLETRGTPVPAVQQIVTAPDGAAELGVADDGTLVYVDAPGVASSTARTLVWVDRTGREEAIPVPPRAYTNPALSPDGTRVAVYIEDQEQDIWIADLARATLTRLTFDPGGDSFPVWMPDGRRLVFASQRGSGTGNLFWQAADGTGNAERLTESPNIQNPTSISPDGGQIVFYEITAERRRDLLRLEFDGVDGRQPQVSGEPGRRAPRNIQVLVHTPFDERNGVVSPDGRWIAYDSGSSGRNEIYVRPFPNAGDGQWQVSTAGGTVPLWTRNGQELFYFGADGALMRVPVEARGSVWNAGTPAKLLEPGYYRGGFGRTYDVSTDGQRFLMIKAVRGSEQTAAPPQIIVVQNWHEELKRLVPVP